MHCLKRSYFSPSSKDILEGLLFCCVTLRNNIKVQACLDDVMSAGALWTLWIDLIFWLLMIDCHRDLDGLVGLCWPNFHALLLLNQVTGTEGDLRRGRVEVKAFFHRPYSDPLTYYGTLVRQQIKPLLSSSCHAICSMSFFKVTKQTFYLFLDLSWFKSLPYRLSLIRFTS